MTVHFILRSYALGFHFKNCKSMFVSMLRCKKLPTDHRRGHQDSCNCSYLCKFPNVGAGKQTLLEQQMLLTEESDLKPFFFTIVDYYIVSLWFVTAVRWKNKTKRDTALARRKEKKILRVYYKKLNWKKRVCRGTLKHKQNSDWYDIEDAKTWLITKQICPAQIIWFIVISRKCMTSYKSEKQIL